MWLCILWSRKFEETFENTQWEKMKEIRFVQAKIKINIYSPRNLWLEVSAFRFPFCWCLETPTEWKVWMICWDHFKYDDWCWTNFARRFCQMYHIATTMEISKAMEISMGLNFGYRMEFSMGHGNFHGGPYFKFQDHGNFHGVWKFPWGSLFHLRRAVMH